MHLLWIVFLWWAVEKKKVITRLSLHLFGIVASLISLRAVAQNTGNTKKVASAFLPLVTKFASYWTSFFTFSPVEIYFLIILFYLLHIRNCVFLKPHPNRFKNHSSGTLSWYRFLEIHLWCPIRELFIKPHPNNGKKKKFFSYFRRSVMGYRRKPSACTPKNHLCVIVTFW